jgi:hypothetical protein
MCVCQGVEELFLFTRDSPIDAPSALKQDGSQSCTCDGPGEASGFQLNYSV